MGKPFSSKRLLVLQIDNGVTQVAEIRMSSKNIQVAKSFSVLTPVGTVEDDGTLVTDAAFAALLREKMREHGIKSDRGVFCVNSDRVISREIMLPNVKRNQILNIISTNAQDYFPVDVSDCKLDYSVQEEVEENGQKKLRILASAVPKQIVGSYYALAKMMEIGIEAIDILGNSVMQAIAVNPDMISAPEDSEGSTYMLVNPYSGGTQLTFVKDGSVRLQRTISVGFDESFETLLQNEENVEMVHGYEAPELDEQGRFSVSMSSYQKASELSAAINRIIEYYYSVEGYGNGKIYGTVIGQAALLPSFAKQLFAELDIEYRKPHTNTAQVENLDKNVADYGLYLPCLGACLHPFNLTDRAQGMVLENICAKRRWLERAEFVKHNILLILSILIFAVCVVISAVMAGYVTIEYSTLQDALADYQAKIELFSEVADQQNTKLNAESVRDLLQAYTQKLEQLEQDKQMYDSLLAEHEKLAETYEALKQACEQLEVDFAYADTAYNTQYAVYDDFSKSIWTWYEEIMYTMDEEYMNTNNDNLVAFIEQLEKEMPSTFTVTSIAVTDAGVNLGIEVKSKEQVIYVIQALREFETVEIMGISGLTIVDGGSSDLFEEEIEGEYNPVQRVRFVVSLQYTDAFRDQ